MKRQERPELAVRNCCGDLRKPQHLGHHQQHDQTTVCVDAGDTLRRGNRSRLLGRRWRSVVLQADRRRRRRGLGGRVGSRLRERVGHVLHCKRRSDPDGMQSCRVGGLQGLGASGIGIASRNGCRLRWPHRRVSAAISRLVQPGAIVTRFDMRSKIGSPDEDPEGCNSRSRHTRCHSFVAVSPEPRRCGHHARLDRSAADRLRSRLLVCGRPETAWHCRDLLPPRSMVWPSNELLRRVRMRSERSDPRAVSPLPPLVRRDTAGRHAWPIRPTRRLSLHQATATAS